MLLKIVPRYQNLKWKIWWPTMMAKTCHLLFWWQRALTNLAACCSRIWRNPKIWCFPLSACQLRLPCSPLAPRKKPSPRWCLPVFRSPTLKTSQELRMLFSLLFIVRSLCFDVLCQKCQQFHNFSGIAIWRLVRWCSEYPKQTNHNPSWTIWASIYRLQVIACVCMVQYGIGWSWDSWVALVLLKCSWVTGIALFLG